MSSFSNTSVYLIILTWLIEVAKNLSVLLKRQWENMG